MYCCFFFFNDTATTEIYTLSLHDALPICLSLSSMAFTSAASRAWVAVPTNPEAPDPMLPVATASRAAAGCTVLPVRSEEHTSELQSRQYLVCRLLLEKKKNNLDRHILLTR